MDRVTFVEQVANKITRLGLAAPAVLLLEAHKPLTFISSQLLLLAQPTLDIIVPRNFTSSVIDLLADAGQFEQLIVSLETRAATKQTPPPRNLPHTGD